MRQKNVQVGFYSRELCEVGHVDVGHVSQDLHQVKAFVSLQPTEEEETRVVIMKKNT